MKARVKATGEIVEIEDCDIDKLGKLKYFTKDFDSYDENEVEIILERDPDYWTRLEHQYAGMAMQTMLATLYNPKYHKELMACYTEVDAEEVARLSKYYAHALVEKMKEADR